MAKPLTADDVLPIVAALTQPERARLLRLLATPIPPETAYRAAPPSPEEFSTDSDPLAWDADGWENVK